MASQSLYRKWRSQTFGDLVGQEPIIRTLKNGLNSGNLAHAYLFAGPRGTGKTSTARLLAKTINCLQSHNGEPCNVCEQCREITAGNSFNVTEIDAASNRGIDSIRELREKVMVPPSTGKYKVYILDEAHMLTTEAFNALLKTLEEPPPHAIFVMATTDVHKMLPTVLSRCQRFDFKRITTRQIVQHLQYIAEQEKVSLERGAAELIARAAAGGMRDALSLLDQAIAYSGQEISLTQVQVMLGVADPRAIQKFIALVANLDGAGGLHLIHELTEAGADLRQINMQIAEYWRAIMLAKAGANIAEILDSTEDEMQDIAQLAQQFALEELTECARIFAQNDLIQKSQGTPQLALELALLATIEIHRHGHAPQIGLSAPPARPASAQSAPPSQERTRVQGGSREPQATALPPTQMRVPPVETQPVPPAEKSAPAEKQPESVVQREEPAATAEKLVSLEQVEVSVERRSELSEGKLVALSVQEKEEPDEPALPDWDSVSYTDDEQDEPGVFLANQEPVVVAAPGLAAVVADAQPVTAVAAEEHVNADAPTLTIEQVKECWEYVRRRVKTKKDGPKIAAFLNGYVIVNVEGTDQLPVVIIRATADFHYKSLQKDEYIEAINWAMKIELGRECSVRLLAPGVAGGSGNRAVIPPPNNNNSLANTMMTLSSSQPARREPPIPAPEKPPAPMEQATKQHQAQQKRAEPSTATSADRHAVIPLARKAVVRENIESVSSAKGETRQQTIEKKAKSDPVVKEVMRLFKAEIKDIQPK